MKKNKKKQGRINRQRGSIWERKVRDDLIKKGWKVSKFQSNVECIKYTHSDCKDPEHWGECKLIPALTSNKFRRGTLGFPDFICWKIIPKNQYNYIKNEPIFDVIGVEAKSDGYLDKTERAKCKWLLENKIFSSILIAKKKKEGRKIVPEYIEFKVEK